MVRVFKCHHFTKQNVLSVDDVPLAMFCEGKKLFLATEPSHIQVFDLESEPPRLLARFPTVGKVLNIAYSDKGNYIATVERSLNGKSTSVQVYLGWQNANVSQAVSVCVAGYMTSHRCEGNCICALSNSNPHVQVIEIPLKGEVTAFSLNSFTGQVIVGVGRHVLVYGLSCKVAASTGKAYKELKCLLDLQFSFVVHHVDYYADYFLCASHRECQLVQLNMPSTSDNSPEIIRETKEENPGTEAGQNDSSDDTDSDPVQSFINWVENPDLNGISRNYIVKDSNFVEWDFAEEVFLSSSLNEADGLKPLPKIKQDSSKTIFLPGICGVRVNEQTGHCHQIIVIGPDSNKPMPGVVVEYEDTCRLKPNLHNLVQRGATSYLYCYLFPNNPYKVISPMLIPVSLYKDESTEDVVTSMFCIISTARETRIYKLQEHEVCCLIAVYSYDYDVKQILIDGSLLYTLSSECLNIYSCNLIADTIKQHKELLSKYKIPQNFPPEPCMIGSESFISLDSMSHSPTKLVLLSKTPCPCQKPGESCWCLYLLQKPTSEELHQDMVELSAGYQNTKLSSYEYLLYLDYMLLISSVFTMQAKNKIQELLQSSALALGFHFGRNIPSEVDQCISFLQQSLYSPLTVLKQYLDTQSKYNADDFDGLAFGIIKYLDQTLLSPSAENIQEISQEDEQMLISFYKTWSPARLMYLVLTGKLSKSSYLQVCNTLLTQQQLQDERLHSLYTLASLATQGNLSTPQATIKKLPEDHLKKLLLLIPECLFCKNKLSKLGMILMEHAPALLCDVFQSLTKQKNSFSFLKNEDMSVDALMKHLQKTGCESV